MTDVPPEVEDRMRRLPRGLRDHVERTRDLARELARIHGVDEGPVDVGAAAHDLARALGGGELLAEAKRLGLDVGFMEERVPILLHGPVAATWIAGPDGVDDPRVIEAVRWHTTGRRGFGPVEKLVFLADKLDPDKVSRNPRLRDLPALARESLDAAIVAFLDQSIAGLLRQGGLIHPESVEFRNELIVSPSGGPDG